MDQWTSVLYSAVMTQQSNPPISKFSVFSMFPFKSDIGNINNSVSVHN